jgi:hypothetical protein
LGAFLCFSQPAGAATVSFDLNFEFSGAQTPAGSPPWGNATFTDTDTNEVTLTLTSYINQGGQTGEWFAEWYFNFNPDLPFNFGTGNFSSTDTNKGGLTIDENNLKADGDGYFDFRFDWRNGVFNSGTVTWTITAFAGNPLTASDFNKLSVTTAGGDDDTGGLPHAGRIRGLPRFDGPNEGSGWFTEQTAVPVPGSALLLAPGLILLGALRRKFKS